MITKCLVSRPCVTGYLGFELGYIFNLFAIFNRFIWCLPTINANNNRKRASDLQCGLRACLIKDCAAVEI